VAQPDLLSEPPTFKGKSFVLGDPITRPKLFQEVAKRIELQILNRQFKPGNQLLSERARVTAPSTETILSELGSSARYMLAQPQGVRSFQQARLLFEGSLARYATQHATPKDIENLEAALAANERAIGITAEFERTDVAFHFAIAQIPNNPIFTALHDALAAWLVEQRATSLRREGAERDAFLAHQRIFNAVEAGDAELAARAMENHLERVAIHYWREKNTTQSAADRELEAPKSCPKSRKRSRPEQLR
jgi:DNA-binding FadR family transcriptional regulator